MSDASNEDLERIAVVGMACRFPGAGNVDAFWRNLKEGVESVAFFSREELLEAGTDPALLDRPDFVPAFAALEGADLFDADFFDLPPREAEVMDPQHRLFLEQAWAALEHAGVDPASYPGPIGVFAGSNMNTYLLNYVARHGARGGDVLQNRIRSDKDFLATLVSYKLNLRGPSMSVQTACSTSLVATHLACHSLLDYQCDVALAGGVSVTVPLKGGYLFRDGVFSSDGHCRAFDERGDGVVGGSGVGVVVLKRLSDALADGDHVHAVILSSAVNNDGSQKVGFSAPSVDGQIEVVAMAHAMADLDPETITMVEAHGTATPLGDPIEVRALTRAFNTDARGFCALGSVKTNIGHMDAAAGVASLIKTVLALEHGEIPPTLHFDRPNPQIDFAASPFYVADRLTPWKTPRGVPRRAGVSAFGVGGTNAHVVLEEPPAADPAPAEERPELLVLSARTPEALDALGASLADHLEEHPELRLADVAFTLQRGRTAFPRRRSLAASAPAEAAALLRGADPTRVSTQQAADSDPGVVFLFSGLGTQYVGMARELYDAEPAFRAAMDRCFRVLREGWGMDLRAVLFPAGAEGGAGGSGWDLRALVRGPGSASGDPLAGARLGHPAMFAVGYALAEAWRSRGIEPRAVVGHSLGEYVAACVAGVFTLEDALTLVVRRAELLDSIPGAMAAVALPEEETAALVAEAAAAGDRVWLAAVNAPRSCVVSGGEEAVARLGERARARGAVVLPLAVRHPFHSGLLEPARADFARVVAGIRRAAPAIPLASNVTGEWLRPEQARSVEYWVEHLVSPVRYARCVDRVRGMGGGEEPVLLEVGPGAVLGSWARQQGAARVAVSLRHAEQPGSDRAVLLRALGQLWEWGVAVDWRRQDGGAERRRVVLPGHPLDRRRFWLSGPEGEAPGRPARGTPAAEGAGRRPPEEWLYAPLWRQLRAAPAADEAAFGGRRVVVFGGAAAAPLAGRLGAAGAEVVRVEPGAEFQDAGERVALRPGDSADYARLADALRGRGWSGAVHTLHLWSLEDPAGEPDAAATAAGMERGFFSALRWVQAAAEAGFMAGGSALLAVTRGAHPVLGSEEVRPWQATLGALLKVVAQEYPQARTRGVDVEAEGWDAAVLREAAQLLDGEAGPPEVAYRGRRRWEPTFAPLPADEPAPREAPGLRPEGVYLITGGLGGIGLALARHLAERVSARLVLTGRRGLPPREGWSAWVAEQGEAEETSRRIRAVEELEALGAEVLVLAADAADPSAMRAAVARAAERFGTLHGVVHAAGVVPGGLIQLKAPEAFAEVLAPKVAGTLALHDAVAGIPLDFMLLCSSVHAIYGGIGSADHCAANTFLDAFAAWRSESAGEPTVSVNWDGWSEVGQAANMTVSRRLGDLLRGPAGTPTGHPLLGSRSERDGGWDYVAELGGATHWVLDEHRIGGIPALPGTAYLEMARAAFADRVPGAAPLLEQVVFLAPMLVPDGDTRTVRLRLEPAGDGFAFRVLSRPSGDGAAAEQEHARGRVLAAGGEGPERLPLEEIRARCAPVQVTEAAPAADGPGLRFGPRWTGLVREVRRGEDELLAELRLGELFGDDVREYALHPALLDAATGFIRRLSDDFFLPFAYERVRVWGSIPARFYSYVRTHGGDDARQETLACDVTVVDESGEERLRIEGFTLRRVPDPAQLASPAAAPAARPAAARGVQPLRAAGHGIPPREGAEAFARIVEHGYGPQVAVSPRDLPAAIERARRFTRDEMVDALRGREHGQVLHPRPELATPHVAPQSDLERTLTELYGRALGIEGVGVDDNFFDLGGESLLATQLLTSLNETFQVDLPLRTLFEAPTPARLALVVVQRQAEEVDDELLAQVLAELQQSEAPRA